MISLVLSHRQHGEKTYHLSASHLERLPEGLDYLEVRGLSREVQQKLNLHKPETIGQASRIQGMTPAAMSLLLVWLKRRDLVAQADKDVSSARRPAA